MLATSFLGLFFLSRIGSLWCLPLCPAKTIPYPYDHRPDSCYLFLDWRVTSEFWTEVWKRQTPGWTYDKDPKKKDVLNLHSAVWDVGQARRICQEIGQPQTNNTKQYQHLRDYKFRLPIIESQDEDNWLYKHLALNETYGPHFWIDLEYDPDKDEHFWFTTGEVLETGNYFSDRDVEDSRWDDEYVQRENLNNIFRICFEFFINVDAMKLRGWHKRPCAQAYSRNQVFDVCVSAITTYPYTRQKIRRDRAPFAVVCELPLYEEAKTTTPSGSRSLLKNQGKLVTKSPPIRKRAIRRCVDAGFFIHAAFVFYFIFV